MVSILNFQERWLKEAFLLRFYSEKNTLISLSENDELALSLPQGRDENISTYLSVDSTWNLSPQQCKARKRKCHS